MIIVETMSFYCLYRFGLGMLIWLFKIEGNFEFLFSCVGNCECRICVQINLACLDDF